MKSGMFRIYLFLKDETGDDYIGKIKFMRSPAEFSSFAGDLRDCEKKSVNKILLDMPFNNCYI